MDDFTKQAYKNRLTKSLKTKLGFSGLALALPLNMAAGEEGFKGNKTVDWVKKNPGAFTKNLATETAIGAVPVGKAASLTKKVVGPVISSAMKSPSVRTGAIAATAGGGSKTPPPIKAPAPVDKKLPKPVTAPTRRPGAGSYVP